MQSFDCIYGTDGLVCNKAHWHIQGDTPRPHGTRAQLATHVVEELVTTYLVARSQCTMLSLAVVAAHTCTTLAAVIFAQQHFFWHSHREVGLSISTQNQHSDPMPAAHRQRPSFPARKINRSERQIRVQGSLHLYGQRLQHEQAIPP